MTLEFVPIAEKNVSRKNVNRYKQGLRAAVRGLWSGVLSINQAFDAMTDTIEDGLTRAWHTGAGECGIKPGEFTPEEIRMLRTGIAREIGYIFPFLEDIERESRANGGKLTPLYTRLDLWINRYNDLKNQAKVMACQDQKLIWQLGRTEKHCKTCPRLHGKVKRASFWAAKGIRPQNPPNQFLECGGWGCLCALSVTDLPISKGPLPG